MNLSAEARCGNRGVPAELLQSIADDVVLGATKPADDLVVNEPL